MGKVTVGFRHPSHHPKLPIFPAELGLLAIQDDADAVQGIAGAKAITRFNDSLQDLFLGHLLLTHDFQD